jgi:hypothetical protein
LLDGPGSSMSFNPADESITKVQGQSIGPIGCSAQCNPPCQFHWINPDGSVVDGSNLTIPSLSKYDHEHLHVMQAMVMVPMQQRTYNWL